MRVQVLASGSKGNSTLVITKQHNILIDLGISKRRIDSILSNIGLSSNSIDSIFLTHEHIDHTSGLAVFLKYSNATLFLSRGTYIGIMRGKNEALKNALQVHESKKLIITFNNLNNRNLYQNIMLDDVFIEPITTFHDAVEPVGYIINENDSKLVFITDTGYIHKNLYEKISNANCYIFECNHDPEVLMNSDRPYSLKMRILSDHGHLSNEDALYTLANVIGDKTKKIYYAHISEECNLFEIINMTKNNIFNQLGLVTDHIKFEFTSQMPLEVYEV